MSYANNKGIDQPVHPLCLISTFVHVLSIISIHSIFKTLASLCSWASRFESNQMANQIKVLDFGNQNNILKGKNVKKCIRMGITVLKIVIWEGKSSALWSELNVWPLYWRFAVKLNFQPQNRRFTSSNDHFKDIYSLSESNNNIYHNPLPPLRCLTVVVNFHLFLSPDLVISVSKNSTKIN